MQLLLDTHVLLWCLTNDPTLSQNARDAIIDSDNLVFVSAVSTWEITIKQALGKLDVPDDLEQEILLHRFEPLPITIAHTVALKSLPSHHNDPFDRLLIAQAKVEKLTFVTQDQKNILYDVGQLLA